MAVELTAGVAGQQPSSIFTCGAPVSFTARAPVLTSSKRPSAGTSNGTRPRSTDEILATSPPGAPTPTTGGAVGAGLEQAARTSIPRVPAHTTARLQVEIITTCARASGQHDFGAWPRAPPHPL